MTIENSKLKEFDFRGQDQGGLRNVGQPVTDHFIDVNKKVERRLISEEKKLLKIKERNKVNP